MRPIRTQPITSSIVEDHPLAREPLGLIVTHSKARALEPGEAGLLVEDLARPTGSEKMAVGVGDRAPASRPWFTIAWV